MKLIQRCYGDSVLLLDEDTVHVWLLPLGQSSDANAKWSIQLSLDEQVRVGRFRFERDRQSWITARGMMRVILGEYVHESPELVRFASYAYGKQYLQDYPFLEFNLSHAGDYGLLGVSHHTIGVDIEQIREHFADPSVARHFFSEAEQTELAAYSGDQYSTAFFTFWTRKEAYIKARGEGLSLPLRDFDVSVDPAINGLIATRPDNYERFRWEMHSVSVPSSYCAYLVIERMS
jgi:4'-phosphopantetheinyl transferase